MRTLRFLARQPILDRRGSVQAYELLFRNGETEGFSGDGELASRTMIDNSVIFGLEQLTCGVPAFVNCTADILTEDLVTLLPPALTVLEVLETVEPSPALIQACRRLKSYGYRIALDDFIWKPSLRPLVELADYIKIDFLQSDRSQRRDMLARFRDLPIVLLAEKVETQGEYKAACEDGFSLFQGYYFCRPTLLAHRAVPANRSIHIQLLQLLQDDPLDLAKVSELVKRDASLAYRLLRLVNSPMCALRTEVHSIQTALMVVGDDLFRRVATLAIASEFNAGNPTEILRMAFVRGKFCELTAKICSADPADQYLLGIFSLLPAMLNAPMTEVIAQLPLGQSVREALLGQANPSACPLRWLEFHERGDWARCEDVARSHSLDPDLLQTCFNESAIWTDRILSAQKRC